MKTALCLAAVFFFTVSLEVAAQQPSTSSTQLPDRNTTYVDDQGTAYITRVVPVPKTVSPVAQQLLTEKATAPAGTGQQSEEESRKRGNERSKEMGEAWGKLFGPYQLEDSQIAGVPVRIVTPDGMPEENTDRILLNLHGGGFTMDAGSYVETIPIAGYTKMKVVGVLYRLAPKNPFPAAIDDAVAVYKELLKSYKPKHIAIYGTSAGAVLTGEVAARLKQLGLPMPAALGIFSGFGDFAHPGDSCSLYGLGGLDLRPLSIPTDTTQNPYYVGKTDPRDPVLSPIYSDLHGLPPTLFVTAGRDMLLSGTVTLHRAFLRAGVDARLVVFDGLWHAFWYDSRLPESIEAVQLMADFFVKELGK